MKSALQPTTNANSGAVHRRVLIYFAWAVLVAVLWKTPLAYPIRLFTTLVHELGHWAAATATGGQFHEIKIYTSGGGHVAQHGGWRFLVSPAGYMGTLICGAILFRLSVTRETARVALYFIAGLVTMFSFAAAGSLTVAGTLLLFVFGVIAVIVMASPVFEIGTVRLLAVFLCMNGV